ncbi:hypothetical protein [Halopiger goleimassiliensis]|uniref:hypothetical protein n=1 Tax=Halopiger goleimassiliensis TaxID=1293048 RepID=UPI0006782192|nr:hypothetical protein [Halopiger goleimassiliensis]
MDSLVAALAVMATPGLLIWTYQDALRVEVGRPMLWSLVVSVPVALGATMYLFATVPTTGVIMTANTGLVLYGFEREVATEEEEPAEPGTLP